jgi:hypothetical protein
LLGALLNRLTHHVRILEPNGESSRLKHSKARRRLNKTSIAGTPSMRAIISASRKFQIEFASGTRSASVSPRKRMNDNRSLIKYPSGRPTANGSPAVNGARNLSNYGEVKFPSLAGEVISRRVD